MTEIAILAARTFRTLRSAPLRRCALRSTSSLPSCTRNARFMSSGRRNNPLERPAPPPLPREDQREFEELVRKAQTPLARSSVGREEAEVELSMHPDARKPVSAEFEGDVNPETGEQGGPKREPVGHWAEGDWSFKGRVSDF